MPYPEERLELIRRSALKGLDSASIRPKPKVEYLPYLLLYFYWTFAFYKAATWRFTKPPRVSPAYESGEPHSRYRQHLNRSVNQVTKTHRLSKTLPQEHKLRPFELVFRHELLDPHRHKRPHTPRQILGRAQEQIHPVLRCRNTKALAGSLPLRSSPDAAPRHCWQRVCNPSSQLGEWNLGSYRIPSSAQSRRCVCPGNALVVSVIGGRDPA